MTTLMVLLLSGSLCAASLFKPQGFAERREVTCFMADSLTSSCGQVCIIGYEDDDCTMDFAITMVEDTAGVIEPLNWPTNSSAQAKSIRYWSPTTQNTSDCNSVQFLFYNSLEQYAGVAYLRPGQGNGGCVDFANDTVVSYNGVTMLVPVPAGFTGVGEEGS